MDHLLNGIWLALWLTSPLLALAACRRQRGVGVPLAPLRIALLTTCAVLLLLPVVSLTDDVRYFRYHFDYASPSDLLCFRSSRRDDQPAASAFGPQAVVMVAGGVELAPSLSAVDAIQSLDVFVPSSGMVTPSAVRGPPAASASPVA